MSHYRTQIRDRFVEMLGSVGTVYASRIYPLAEAKLPVILVYTNEEEIELESFSDLRRKLTVVVEIVAQATADLDTTLDDLLQSVETALESDPTVNGLAMESLPAQIEVTMSKDGAQPVGRAKLSYSVLYHTGAVVGTYPDSPVPGGGLPEAPIDGNTYGRQNADWVTVSGGGVPEAPSSGSYYARQNAAWANIDGYLGGGGQLPTQTGHARKVLQTDGTLAIWQSKAEVHVNDFYPNGAVAHNGASHPLSGFFNSLGEAQAVYPHATSLSDEIDWCAWQGALNYVYDRDDGSYSNYNMSAATIVWDGQYVVNKTVVFNHCAVKLVAASPQGGFPFAGATSIKYNGPDATADAPVPIWHFYIYDENGNVPPGRVGNPASGGMRVIIDGGSFNGKGTYADNTLGFSKYISGIRFEPGVFVQISNCAFGGWLYDAIYFTGPQLFTIIERNFFQHIERDAIAVWAYRTNFTTTTWIYNNEFVYVTRYSILLDLSGSVEAFPIIRDNSFEPMQTVSSYYITRPEWWCQGVPAINCIIDGGNLVWSGNREEIGVAAAAQYLWCTLHLLSGREQTIEQCTGTGNLVLSTHRNTVDRTSQAKAMWGNAPAWQAGNVYSTALDGQTYVAADSYYHQCTAGGTSGGSTPTWNTTIGGTTTDGGVTWTCKGVVRRYHDLTDARNYNACKITDFNASTPIQNITLRKLSSAVVFLMDGVIGISGIHSIQDIPSGIKMGNLPTVVGTYAELAQPRTTAKPALMTIPGWFNLQNVMATELTGTRQYGSYLRGTGNYLVVGSTTAFSAWQGTHAYKATWQDTLHHVIPTVDNGYFYRCTTTGTSGGVEPTWPTTVGNTVTDGPVVWTCVGTTYFASENGANEWVQNGVKNRTGTAAPTTGTWAIGAKIWNTGTAAGGYTGWVCTVAGTPGTWKGFGLIES